MKDSKFIELLNLYVDHQITADDAALLESEVRTNPDRRRVYRQYCQMQKACTQLGEVFRTEAPAPAATSNITEFKPRHRSYGVAVYAGTFGAMAACIILAVVIRSGAPKPAIDSGSLAVAAAPVAPIVTVVTAPRPALQPVLGPRSLNLREQNTELADATPASYPAAFGDWMNEVRLSSMDEVSIDDLRFDGHGPSTRESRSIRLARPFQGKVESVAVRFQR
ncbi:MAG: putative transrane anti-sigma factor [Verrucomicrobia bacterium]|nr:putative transrane anti-sigma factor [Verrucomicrobiota bacterium]